MNLFLLHFIDHGYYFTVHILFALDQNSQRACFAFSSGGHFEMTLEECMLTRYNSCSLFICFGDAWSTPRVPSLQQLHRS